MQVFSQISIELPSNGCIDCNGKGTISGDPGSCSGAFSLVGDFNAGCALNGSQYVDIQVDVSQTGAYFITTNNVNNYVFYSAGTFASTGANTIRLYAYGVPNASGTNTFTVSFGNSTCTFDSSVSSASCPNQGSSAASGEITHSVRSSDFDCYYLMDGRSLSSLPASAQAAAAALGITGNLPDASGRYLQTKNNAGGSLLGTGGSSSISLTRANLPNFNMSGSTSSAGNHSHSGSTNTAGNHNHNYASGLNYIGPYNLTAGGDSNLFVDNNGTPNVFFLSTAHSGNHSHSLSINSAGNHSHSFSVNSGGSGSAVNFEPQYLSVNTFINLCE